MTSTESDLQSFIASERDRFKELPFEDVAFPRGCKELDKWIERSNSSKIYKTGTPIHVKGAIIYNHLLNKLKLTNKYEEVRKGEKIKFSYLRTPNILNEHVISVPGKLPPELNLHSIIDYDTQFDKSFLEPLRTILDVIGWETEKRNTLEDFFR
jgi:hypothetical protein